MICYKTRHQMHTEEGNDLVTIQSEIFALGCTFYEIWAAREPYAELVEEEVLGAYRRGAFPDVTDLPSASVISQCWKGELRTGQAVLDELKSIHDSSKRPKISW